MLYIQVLIQILKEVLQNWAYIECLRNRLVEILISKTFGTAVPALL